MNVIINEDYSFIQLVNGFCDKVSGDRHFLKEESGEGFMDLIHILPGLDYVYAEFSILEPLMVKWDFKGNDNQIFYLIHVESKHKETNEDLNFKLADEGTSVISQNNHRFVLWLPKVKYRIISVRFSLEWMQTFDKSMTVHKNTLSFINGKMDLSLLYVKRNADISQVIHQMYKYKSLIDKEAATIYLHSKIVELLLLMFHITLRVSTDKNIKNTVHIDDYTKIIEFTDDFVVNGIIPEKIEDVARRNGMSRSKFQRIFKLVKGQTYYNFVLDVRMVKAMELLMESKSITEVSDLTGYSAISNFTHAFNNYYKIPPGEFKKGSVVV